MPEYLYPGVYVEEIDTGNKPIEGVSTSTAGFLGIAERGAITPTLLTSFGDYQRAYGGYVKDALGDHYLAYAVEGFFQNGGLRCFVQRVFHQDLVTPANSALSASATVGGITISANGPGAWGNTVAYQISNAGLADPTLFKLTVLYWTGTPSPDLVSNPTIAEVYDNLSSVPTSSTFYDGAINNVSNLISVAQTAPGRPPNNPVSATGTDPNVQVSSQTTTPLTQLPAGATLIITAGQSKASFIQNTDPTKGPTIITVTDLINNINLDTTVGAKASLNRAGNLTIVDPLGRGSLGLTGTLLMVSLGTFSPTNGGSNLNLLVGSTTALTGNSALPDGGTLVLTAGAATVTFKVNASAGPIKSVSDLIKAINADAVVGAKASLDASGRLNIQDPQLRNNLAATGTLAVAGTTLGGFSAAAATLNNAGTPILLQGGGDGLNPNLLVGAVGGLTAPTPLPDTETLVLTAGAATVTFTVSAAAGPIKLLGDLIAAISTDVVVGAQASLDGAGRLNLSDPLMRGNLTVTGTLTIVVPPLKAPVLGAFSKATAQLVPEDFQGTDEDPTQKTGLTALADVDEIAIVCCPDEYYFGPANTTIAGMLQSQCESLKNRFAILESPVSAGQPENNNPSVNSEYAAYYYPWLYVANPNTGVQLLVPPCGHMAGIYARSDTNVGVQKDPANEVINGIVKLQLQTNNQQQAILNVKGVNVLRYFTGAGNLVWGGRTTSTDPDWQYINVRRIFIFVESSIQRGTQWVVFDINSDPTWRRVVRSVSDFLTGLWRDGVLQGATKDQAFFVRCDNTTMTQADIDAGRLICIIGIAPVKPAEFVIFRIGQWYGGSDITEQ
ncbi:phage tail sheath subtilisin-like domain-containing protein [Tunturibacter psychrotolerans]|uniref:Phage tail sheath subtilisin-like domain-containing protein n=1 Tax=Tunturiibacter psychrotolerans TaxID=3069686 RepID=A0AAU7ZRR0_9BACT